MDDFNPYEPPGEELPEEAPPDLYQIACRAAEGTQYPPEAFVFAIQAFEFATEHIQHAREEGHRIDAEDLCWTLHDLAIYRFAEDARTQLASWNVTSTRDFGALVYRLIDFGLVQSHEGDSPENFDDVFEFSAEFKIEEFRPRLLIDEDE